MAVALCEPERKLGIGSMRVLLFTEEDNLGALNLYSSRSEAFPAGAEHLGWVLGSQAAVEFSGARHAQQLQAAIAT